MGAIRVAACALLVLQVCEAVPRRCCETDDRLVGTLCEGGRPTVLEGCPKVLVWPPEASRAFDVDEDDSLVLDGNLVEREKSVVVRIGDGWIGG